MAAYGGKKQALNKRKAALSDLRHALIERDPHNGGLSQFLDDLIKDMTTTKKIKENNDGKVREVNGGKGGSVSHYEHSMLVAKHLRDKGYHNIKANEFIPRKIDGEFREALHPDIVAHNGGISIVEVEMNRYRRKRDVTREEQGFARFVGKIARYSAICNDMVLAYPAKDFNILFFDNTFDIPLVKYFVKPPSERSDKEISMLKELVDKHYTQPKLEPELLRYAHLDGIYLTNMWKLEVEEVDLNLFRSYLE